MNLSKIGNKKKNQLPETFFDDLLEDNDYVNYCKENGLLEDNKETIVYNDLKQYKKAIDKYCFTISFGCMLKIGLLLVGSTLLTIFKIWYYCNYC